MELWKQALKNLKLKFFFKNNWKLFLSPVKKLIWQGNSSHLYFNTSPVWLSSVYYYGLENKFSLSNRCGECGGETTGFHAFLCSLSEFKGNKCLLRYYWIITEPAIQLYEDLCIPAGEGLPASSLVFTSLSLRHQPPPYSHVILGA